uniref:Uncharacterized protein n=1 Tax=Steinernema glaseri TaxID=37863 RepID=A0A1I7YZD5_9BILA
MRDQRERRAVKVSNLVSGRCFDHPLLGTDFLNRLRRKVCGPQGSVVLCPLNVLLMLYFSYDEKKWEEGEKK